MTADFVRAALGEAVAAIRSRTDLVPDTAIVLDPGLDGPGLRVEVETEIPFAAIPHMPGDRRSGRLTFGRLAGRSVAVVRGRLHRYEGYSLQQVTFPVRVVALLGARTLVVTGACGGLNPLWSPGDLVLIDDHINMLGDNPLVGPNLDDLGPRFPDMSEAYDRELQAVAEAVARELKQPLRRGVYVAVTGPNLATRAEYRMLRGIGADVVGTSIVPEVIVARHMDMTVLGVGVMTNACLPDALEPASIDALMEVAARAEPSLAALVEGVLETLPAAPPVSHAENALTR